MRLYPAAVVGTVAAALWTGVPAPVAAQSLLEMEWKMMNLRPTGQPVIPVFDGWIPRDDGTRDLCFGYFNMNTQHSFEIPLGPDNFIEPAQFDGAQPTHFREVPPRYRRYYCTFTVNVPENFTDKVVWTIRVDGQTFSVPGHTNSPVYMMEGLAQPSRNVVAPVLQFVEPAGEAGRGRTGVRAAGARAVVGQPMTITTSVSHPDGKSQSWLLLWTKHQGPPGAVAFSPDEIQLPEGESRATTTATFSEPGTYLLRAQAVDGGRGSFGFHCCWTNGYLEVTVAP